MKKALYIYGFNSNSNSSTKSMLNKVFNELGYEVVSVDYDQLNPYDSLTMLEKYIVENGIDLVIGSSLGAFYTLCVCEDVKKIVINPCMFPSKELPKIIKLSNDVIRHYSKLEGFLYKYNDTLSIDDVMGFFGTHDELFSYYDYFKSIFPRAYKFNSAHRPTIDAFTNEVVNKIKKYINE